MFFEEALSEMRSGKRFKFRAYDPVKKTYYNDFYLMSDGNGAIYTPLEEGEDENRLIIEQCTGLKDKNGKLIYEGDLVQSKFNGLGRIAYYHAMLVVLWKKEVFFMDHTTTSTPIPLDTENIEVIGNIHENQDLLK